MLAVEAEVAKLLLEGWVAAVEVVLAVALARRQALLGLLILVVGAEVALGYLQAVPVEQAGRVS